MNINSCNGSTCDAVALAVALSTLAVEPRGTSASGGGSSVGVSCGVDLR